jgi:hypothetical protein
LVAIIRRAPLEIQGTRITTLILNAQFQKFESVRCALLDSIEGDLLQLFADPL